MFRTIWWSAHDWLNDWSRAGFYDEPDLSTSRALLQEYTEVRLAGASSADRKRDTAAMILFALAFVAVLIIIVDLDRPQEGLLTVSQQAMEDLLRSMSATGQ